MARASGHPRRGVCAALPPAVLAPLLAPLLAALLSAAPVAAPAAEMDASEIARRLMMQRGGDGVQTAAAPYKRTDRLRGTAPAAAAPVTIDLEILFASGSAALSPPAVRQLAALCAALRADLRAGPRRYQIVGHTDAAGDARENLILSQSRAESVAGWLSGPECGLDGRRLTPVGMGETRLKIPDRPDAPANRRVEIKSLS
ncbi:OmpA family protein [Rhodovulum sp. DZ06]|uniref:OmpA family protein n=1 Tax=Rhodovulum sp. DZ06 TaxID=3425126 RepID=UPI003D343FA8